MQCCVKVWLYKTDNVCRIVPRALHHCLSDSRPNAYRLFYTRKFYVAPWAINISAIPCWQLSQPNSGHYNLLIGQVAPSYLPTHRIQASPTNPNQVQTKIKANQTNNQHQPAKWFISLRGEERGLENCSDVQALEHESQDVPVLKEPLVQVPCLPAITLRFTDIQKRWLCYHKGI